MHIKVKDINEALREVGSKLLEEGVLRETRGFDCIELPEPIIVTIEYPTLRYITNEARGWNKYLGFAESLWLLNGVNHMEMVGGVVKNLYNFSDDGETMRAGYGPRIRAFSGIGEDYNVQNPAHRDNYSLEMWTVDQLKYVVELLKQQPDSRQASITIHDPAKDCFNADGSLKTTKDQPCTRLLQFMIVDGKLDCTTYMRSNDFLWGFSAVNLFNFTLLQEVVAGLVGVPIGRYHHVVNNLHYYSNFKGKVEEVVNEAIINDPEPFNYDFKGITLEEFDNALKKAYYESVYLSRGNGNPHYELQKTGVQIVDDMLCAISRKFQGITASNEKFVNPLINELFNE